MELTYILYNFFYTKYYLILLIFVENHMHLLIIFEIFLIFQSNSAYLCTSELYFTGTLRYDLALIDQISK